MLTSRNDSWVRWCALFALTLYLPCALSCSHWEPMPIRDLEATSGTLSGKRVRFYEPGHTWDILVQQVEYPMVRGPKYKEAKSQLYEVDLRNITGIEIYHFDGTKTFFAVTGILALTILVIAIIVAATDSPSEPATSGSGSSCPTLYVRGPNGTLQSASRTPAPRSARCSETTCCPCR